ncbi:MAG: hypothetical protein C4554_02580 [Dethiobacter sp.]|jgi:hypothetical protein|nr:MAG: hypothetical protein C4554_02580 [Dethiobacter sp.]
MKLHLIQWLIQGIPECIAVFFLGLVLFEKRLNIKKALIPGLMQAIILYLVRLFPLPFGIHTLIAIISLSILLSYVSRGRYSKALIISFFVYMALGLSELALLPAASYLLNMPLEIIFNQPLLLTLVGLPQVFILILLAFLVNLFHNKRKNHNGKNFQGAK